MVSPPGSPDHGTVVSPTLHLALTAMLTRHRAPTAPGIERAETDSDLYDESRCRTKGCEEDPNDGEGWDGFCGNCADRRYAAGTNIDDD